MTAILVVTIGTRDLMYQATSGIWYNIGNDRLKEDESITEKIEALSDLKLGENTTYRDLTHHLLQHQDQYLDRLKPVIIGKLISDNAQQIQQCFLIGTDQPHTVPQRISDTIHSSHIIKAWIEKNYKIPTTVLPLCADGTSPADFEAMFKWWRKTWLTTIKPPQNAEIWLGITGGVGQTSEAGRISGLSLYGDRIKFFKFKEDPTLNRAGHPSNYSAPFLGTNYLWDRTRQQALKLLDRSDYAGAKELLEPYLKAQKTGAATPLLEAGILWHQGQFDPFFRKIKSYLPQGQQVQSWWSMAYEQAYLAVIRLEQDNTTEAALHSFRAIEGCLLEWAKVTLTTDFNNSKSGFPEVRPTICDRYPSIRASYKESQGHHSKRMSEKSHKERNSKGSNTALPMVESAFQPTELTSQTSSNAQWSGKFRQELLEAVLPAAKGAEFQAFWKSQGQRNRLSHQLGGISKQEVFSAWGQEIRDQPQWESQILTCLNILTGQSFKTLQQASLFTVVQKRVQESIEKIELV
jgi:hypothetical protein